MTTAAKMLENQTMTRLENHPKVLFPIRIEDGMKRVGKDKFKHTQKNPGDFCACLADGKFLLVECKYVSKNDYLPIGDRGLKHHQLRSLIKADGAGIGLLIVAFSEQIVCAYGLDIKKYITESGLKRLKRNGTLGGGSELFRHVGHFGEWSIPIN